MANYCSGESVCSSLSWDQPIAPLFYSPEYERELMERYLPDSPSRSEFMAGCGSEVSSPLSSCEAAAPTELGGKLTGFGNGNEWPLYDQTEYERSLVDQYLPGWGNDNSIEFDDYSPSSSSADSLELRVPDEQPIEEEEYYEEEGVNYMDVPYESSDYSPTPSPQPVPKKPVVRQTRAKVAPSQIQMQSQGVRKRGRPAGSKSNSKMAQYSKQYREAKKNEAAALNDQIDALARDNDRLAEDNDRLKREVELLRRADSISTKLATLLETHRRNPGVFRLCVDTNGTPFLEVI